LAEKTEVQLNQLSLTQLKTLHPAFEEDVSDIWDFDCSVEKRDSYGGTSKRRVLEQVEELRAKFAF
jgi:argininosuccinate lyase